MKIANFNSKPDKFKMPRQSEIILNIEAQGSVKSLSLHHRSLSLSILRPSNLSFSHWHHYHTISVPYLSFSYLTVREYIDESLKMGEKKSFVKIFGQNTTSSKEAG